MFSELSSLENKNNALYRTFLKRWKAARSLHSHICIASRILCKKVKKKKNCNPHRLHLKSGGAAEELLELQSGSVFFTPMKRRSLYWGPKSLITGIFSAVNTYKKKTNNGVFLFKQGANRDYCLLFRPPLFSHPVTPSFFLLLVAKPTLKCGSNYYILAVEACSKNDKDFRSGYITMNHQNAVRFGRSRNCCNVWLTNSLCCAI